MRFFTAFAMAAIAASGVSATGFMTITVDGKVVKDGDVIVSNRLLVDGEDGELWSWELKPDFTISASTDASYSMTVTNTETSKNQLSYCGVSGATTNTFMCQSLRPGDGWTDEGELKAGRSYNVAYDYQHIDLNNLPDRVECYGHIRIDAESADGIESIEFDLNMIWPDGGAGEDLNVAEVHVDVPGTLAQEIRLQSGLMPASVTKLIVTGQLNANDFTIMRSNMLSCNYIDLSGISNTEIPERSFINKTGLANLILPNALERIGDQAFEGCSNLHIPELPETIRFIGSYAFMNCTSLDNYFIMPSNLEILMAGAFSGCKNLKGIDLTKTKVEYLSQDLFNGCFALSEVLPNQSIKIIYANAFTSSSISGITLPSTVTAIGNNAFENCRQLQTIVLPDGLETIGNYCFRQSGLTSVSLPSTLTYIGIESFANTKLFSIDFPDALKTIPDRTLNGCWNLTYVNLPAGLENIGTSALSSLNISHISSPSVEPAQTSGNPFNGINTKTCMLTIPRQSFAPYLTAEFWGSFVGINNSIDITLSEDVDLSYMTEEEYNNLIEKSNNQSAPSNRLCILRETQESEATSNGKGYGRLFNGASLYCTDDTPLRFFVNAEVGYNVILNGKDITQQLSDNMFVINGKETITSLEVKAVDTSLNSISNEKNILFTNGPEGVYTLTGIKIGEVANTEDISALPKGIYLIGGQKIAVTK